jgi:hypothetical protein
MRHQLHAVRRGRGVSPHALCGRPQARRPLCRQRFVRSRWRAAPDEKPVRCRPSSWRLHDRDRAHHRGKPAQRALERRAGRGATGGQSVVGDRGRGRAQGQPRARGSDREDRRHEKSQVHRAGALLRWRGSLLRGGRGPQVQRRRRPGDPLRGAARRPRHARDAFHHRGALRPGYRRQGRAHHRRALLRRDPRFLHRAHRSGSGGRRADRVAARRRRHRNRRGKRHAECEALHTRTGAAARSASRRRSLSTAPPTALSSSRCPRPRRHCIRAKPRAPR